MRSSRKWLRYRKRTRKQRKRQRGGSANTISFISYGNDTYKDARDRIQSQATTMGCFNGQIKVYTPEDLSADFKAAVGDVLNESRGGGYWIWKPYIIADMLSKLNTDDILVYADAGCTLQPVGVPRLKEYAEMISPKSGKSILAMRLLDGTKYGPGGFLQKKWTSTPIFEYFNQAIDGEFANSSQILCGVVICRKCPESEKVIGRWLEVARSRPDLFTDRHNEESKKSNPAFIDNRHDQPIFSMIVQTPPYNEYCKIIDEEIEVKHGTPNTEKVRQSSPIVADRVK